MRTLVALLAVLTLAGCGSTTREAVPSPTAPATTVEDSIEPQLSALCTQYNPTAEKINARIRAHLEAGALDDAADGFKEYLATAAKFDAEVAALDPPDDEAGALRRYRGANKRNRELMREFVGDLEAGDTSTASAIKEDVDRLQQARLDAALELGADECGG